MNKPDGGDFAHAGRSRLSVATVPDVATYVLIQLFESMRPEEVGK
jgi:hypothetical protein